MSKDSQLLQEAICTEQALLELYKEAVLYRKQLETELAQSNIYNGHMRGWFSGWRRKSTPNEVTEKDDTTIEDARRRQHEVQEQRKREMMRQERDRMNRIHLKRLSYLIACQDKKETVEFSKIFPGVKTPTSTKEHGYAYDSAEYDTLVRLFKEWSELYSKRKVNYQFPLWLKHIMNNKENAPSADFVQAIALVKDYLDVDSGYYTFGDLNYVYYIDTDLYGYDYDV